MDESPIIESHISESDHWPGGAGEPSTPGIAPAVANAIFNACEIRIRELPIKNHRLKADSSLIGTRDSLPGGDPVGKGIG